MKVYKVACHSDCGSYFMGYLQSVTVIADDKKDAIEKVKKWMKDKGESFIYPESKWDVYLIRENVKDVIDYHFDSDY